MKGSFKKHFLCDSEGKFMPVYFYMFIMLTFVFMFCGVKLADVIIRLCMGKPLELSDFLLTSLIGGVVVWAKFYNDGKNQSKEKCDAGTTAKPEDLRPD